MVFSAQSAHSTPGPLLVRQAVLYLLLSRHGGGARLEQILQRDRDYFLPVDLLAACFLRVA
jgi:hypothetical protein